jgi:hypothetical protein
MTESGQINRLWDKWKAKPTVGCLGEGAEPLSPGTVLAAFVILGLAALLSALILLVEVFIERARGKPQPHHSARQEAWGQARNI